MLMTKTCFLSFILLLGPVCFYLKAVDRDEGSAALNLRQKIVVSGTVIDDNGDPLPGVNITEKGTTNGTTTDLDGHYTITVSGTGAVLTYSFIGYLTKEIAVGNQSTIDIKLTFDLMKLDEVVVVGYGTAKKSDVTGALVRVNSEQIKDMPVSNSLEALQGKASGVDITSNERPGEVGKILIRGVRSLNASNDPLFVVDGIPLSSGGIETLNPKDIESVDILKDASATAIYGSRGANGVVLVTTKKGKINSFSLTYNASLSIEKMYDRVTMMNSPQYIKFRRDAYRRAGLYPDDPTYDDDYTIFGGDEYAWSNVAKGWESGTWDGSKVNTTDWTSHVLKTGITHEHTLSVSGGTEKMNSYASFGYLKQDGTQLGQDYQRYTTTVKVDIDPVKWFKTGVSVVGTYSDQNYGYKSTTSSKGAGNIYFAALGMLPYAVPYDNEGNRIAKPGGDDNILNPIDETDYNVNERWINRVLGSFYAELKLTENLKYRFNFGPDFRNYKNGIWKSELSIDRGAGEDGSTNYAQYDMDYRFAWTLDNLIYYDKEFLSNQKINITLLQTASKYHIETSSMTATDLPWNEQLWYNLASVSELDSYGSGLTETALNSYMGRINYSFRDKYLFTASVRWDGASQLAEGHKWDVFPSAAIAWRMEQEEFLKQMPWINQLKVRLGLGTTGNAAISAYETKGDITALYYTWGATVDDGYVSSDPSLKYPNKMPNVNLGWELTTQWNFGIDFGLLKNRISGTLDLYTSRTNDVLMERTILSVNGYPKTWDNIGVTSNKGIDLTLNTINIQNNYFTWSTGLTFSASSDKIIELINGKEDDITNKWFIDKRLSVYYDYQKLGIWQNTPEDLAEMEKFNANGCDFEPGDIKVKDLNGDYDIDANNDRTLRGHKNPNWTSGLTSDFSYKNWSLSFFIYTRWNFTIETGEEYLQARYAQRLVDYWTTDNPTNDYPAPDYSSGTGDTYSSSMNYQDGSFIKLRHVALSYTLPKNIAEKAKLENVKLSVQLKNPGLLYSGCDWIDPDLGGSTFNKSLVFGLSVNF